MRRTAASAVDTGEEPGWIKRLGNGKARRRCLADVSPAPAGGGSAASAVVVGVARVAAAAMLAFDVTTELPHAAARAAAVFVGVTGAAGVAAAIERSVIGEAVVGAMDDLQQRKLPAAGGDEVAPALLVAIAGSPERNRVGGCGGLLATKRNGNDAGQHGEATERAAPRNVAGNRNRQAIESIRIHVASPLPSRAAGPRPYHHGPAAQFSRYVQTTATGTRSLANASLARKEANQTNPSRCSSPMM